MREGSQELKTFQPIREYQVPTKPYMKANIDGKKLFYICPICRRQWVNKTQCSKHITRCVLRRNLDGQPVSSSEQTNRKIAERSIKIQTQPLKQEPEELDLRRGNETAELYAEIERLNARIDRLEGRKNVKDFNELDVYVEAEEVIWRVWNMSGYALGAVLKDRLKQVVIAGFKQHIDMRRNIDQLARWVENKVGLITFDESFESMGITKPIEGQVVMK